MDGVFLLLAVVFYRLGGITYSDGCNFSNFVAARGLRIRRMGSSSTVDLTIVHDGAYVGLGIPRWHKVMARGGMAAGWSFNGYVGCLVYIL